MGYIKRSDHKCWWKTERKLHNRILGSVHTYLKIIENEDFFSVLGLRLKANGVYEHQ